ncbi:hypothetical protein CPB85DRAFT_1255486 [Mucidula mucida]|nr:hypothetical protein CPB85DRAFT_1255486 [Mucidula mucida]
MSKTACLCDLTTEPGCNLASFLKNELVLDGLEYHMGMSRGVHSNMIELFKSGSWGLLPPWDVLQKIYKLYNHNQKLSTPTSAGMLFTVVLPEKEYEYELLPVCTANNLPIYIGEERHNHPYTNLPRVKSTIHPCFVIESAFNYTLGDLDYAPNSLTDDDSLRVNLLWLHGTWDDFKDRPVPVARPDPRPKRKLPPVEVEDADSEGYASDQPHNLNDPRILKRRKGLQAYIAKHNRRYEDEENDEEEEQGDDNNDEDGGKSNDEDEGDGSHPRHITSDIGRQTRSDSGSQELIDCTDVRVPNVRRSKRLQSSDASVQSVVG